MAGAATAIARCCEAIKLCEEISGRELTWKYEEDNRIGDHIWWISDVRKFQEHYPDWKFRYGLRESSRRFTKPWSRPKPSPN